MLPERALQGKVKGAAVRSFIQWYVREVDPERLRAIVLTLPEAEREEFDVEHITLGVLPSNWYSAKAIHGILDRLTAGLEREQLDDLGARAGKATAAAILTGVHRVLFERLLNPAAYCKLAERAFRLNYESGHLENIAHGPRRHEGIVSGWKSHHPFLCRMNVAIKAELYRAMRCKGVRVERRFCRDDGDDRCGSIIVWNE
jgi:hypothetical protein